MALATQSGRPNTAGLVLLSGYYFPTFRIDALMIAPGAGDDFSGRHRMAERLIASAPGSTLPIVQGAGHMIITLPAIRWSMQSMLSSASPNRRMIAVGYSIILRERHRLVMPEVAPAPF